MNTFLIITYHCLSDHKFGFHWWYDINIHRSYFEEHRTYKYIIRFLENYLDENVLKLQSMQAQFTRACKFQGVFDHFHLVCNWAKQSAKRKTTFLMVIVFFCTWDFSIGISDYTVDDLKPFFLVMFIKHYHFVMQRITLEQRAQILEFYFKNDHSFRPEIYQKIIYDRMMNFFYIILEFPMPVTPGQPIFIIWIRWRWILEITEIAEKTTRNNSDNLIACAGIFWLSHS